MASTFQFKLDPSSLPKLSSRGENYAEWRSSWTVAFRYAGLWPIVSKKKARPTAANDTAVVNLGQAQETWDQDDNKALVMLLSAVHNDLTMSITGCDTSPQAWEYLANRFDRDTGNTAILLFRSLTNLRYRDGDDLRLHLDEFHQRWTRMAKRTLASTKAVAVAMRPVFASDEVKGSFFLATLPDTMDNVIDNLSTRNLTAFQDIEPKILDISEKHSLDSVDTSTAYAARQTAARSANRPSTGGQRPPTGQECSWCRKHNLTFIGHVYTNCNELKQHKERQQRKGPTTQPPKGDKRGGNKRHKGHNAEATAADDSDDSGTEITGFTAGVIDLRTPPSTPAKLRSSINRNGKRSRQD
jgi:hypothetical protein